MRALLSSVTLVAALLPQQTKQPPKPDLVVEVVKPGSCSQAAQFRVKNVGGATAGPSFVAVRLSESLLKTLKVPELAPAQTSAIFTAQPEGGTWEGLVHATADSGGVVDELDESNDKTIGGCIR